MNYEIFRELRQKRKLTQQIVSKKAKISQTYLSQIESGKKEPSPAMFRKLCKIYKAPPVLVFWLCSELKDVKTDKQQFWEAVKKPMNELINAVI